MTDRKFDVSSFIRRLSDDPASVDVKEVLEKLERAWKLSDAGKEFFVYVPDDQGWKVHVGTLGKLMIVARSFGYTGSPDGIFDWLVDQLEALDRLAEDQEKQAGVLP